MASVNKVILLGNLGRDPETRYVADGGAITNFTLATSSSWKDKATGQRKEDTEWHRVVYFGKLAEVAGEFAKKGSPVYVEGRLKTRKWKDKDGNDRYTTEVVGDVLQLLGAKPTEEPQESPSKPAAQGSIADMADDVPFMRMGHGGLWRVI